MSCFHGNNGHQFSFWWEGARPMRMRELNGWVNSSCDRKQKMYQPAMVDTLLCHHWRRTSGHGKQLIPQWQLSEASYQNITVTIYKCKSLLLLCLEARTCGSQHTVCLYINIYCILGPCFPNVLKQKIFQLHSATSLGYNSSGATVTRMKCSCEGG